MFIVFGLGNPGTKYASTRHNIGFTILDELAQEFRLKFKSHKKLYKFSDFTFIQNRVILVKPLTFMNLSGKAVQSVLTTYKLSDLSNLLVIYDDIDLPFGALRLRERGSHGGQKGMKSIITTLGTGEFPRLRVGIGNHDVDAAAYVLSRFNKNEKAELPTIIKTASEVVQSFILNGIQDTMNRYNGNVLDK